ncbi:dihydropteroate synthase [Vagococcus sp.]|uniref:dihydropteroate synthase n=1 Tax=Vagococcus sp. TaxID=1933889 RepID=UPI003F99A553
MFHKNQIMGILNVTPDSFSDGGDYSRVDKAMEHAKEIMEAGVDIIDIGGQSTRPGYIEIPKEEELARVLPIVKGLRQMTDLPISVDTYFPEVAEAVIEAGATIINDIKGLDMPGMGEVVAHYQVPVVLMHSRYRDETVDVVTDMQKFYAEKIALCQKLGIAPEKICFDPGVGFHKSIEENKLMIAQPNKFRFEDYPLLYGVSRKRTIAQLTDEINPKERDFGSVAASLYVLNEGVEIVRVHQVKGMRDALSVWTKLEALK